MSVQILPYSVEEYNKVPFLGTSAQDFQHRQGKAFVLSSLRLLLFEYTSATLTGRTQCRRRHKYWALILSCKPAQQRTVRLARLQFRAPAPIVGYTGLSLENTMKA